MDTLRLAKQMIEFNKISFDNTYSAMLMFQEQAEKMVRAFIDQSPWLPAEGKKILDEWIMTFKKGREEYKKSVDESFKKVEAYFNSQAKTGD